MSLMIQPIGWLETFKSPMRSFKLYDVCGYNYMADYEFGLIEPSD